MSLMNEKSITIAGECELEAGLALGSGPEGVVLAHPHPLYGGDMRNPLITAMMEFSSGLLPGLELVIVGEEDDIAPPEKVRPLAKIWNPTASLVSIDAADHFFSGCLNSVEAVLRQFLQKPDK